MSIRMDGLEYGYSPSVPVIKGLSLSLDKPEFVCIMGPNGVGKSTIIHCLNRVLRPPDRQVFLDGMDVNEYKLKDLAKHMGYVPASSSDAFPLTVIDTIMIGLQNDMRFGTSNEDLKKVEDVMKLMRIEDLAMRNFDELSAGQHQKVVLARGMVRTPEILLLDEPTSNLDIKHQLQVTKVLSELPRTKGMLVVMISHDINISAKYADRIILIHDGKVFANGTPLEVLTKENIRTVYGVDADIIVRDGHPHVILNEALEE